MRGKVYGLTGLLVAIGFFIGAFFLSKIEHTVKPCAEQGIIVYPSQSFVLKGCPLDETVETVEIDVQPAGGNPAPFTTELMKGSNCEATVPQTRCDSWQHGKCTGSVDVENMEMSEKKFCVKIHCQSDFKEARCAVQAKMTYQGGINEPTKVWRLPYLLGIFITLLVFGFLFLVCAVFAFIRKDDDGEKSRSRGRSNNEGEGEVFNLRVLSDN